MEELLENLRAGAAPAKLLGSEAAPLSGDKAGVPASPRGSLAQPRGRQQVRQKAGGGGCLGWG